MRCRDNLGHAQDELLPPACPCSMASPSRLMLSRNSLEADISILTPAPSPPIPSRGSPPLAGVPCVYPGGEGLLPPCTPHRQRPLIPTWPGKWGLKCSWFRGCKASWFSREFISRRSLTDMKPGSAGDKPFISSSTSLDDIQRQFASLHWRGPSLPLVL